jgi:multiple sugar transport system ATP-binding protein
MNLVEGKLIKDNDDIIFMPSGSNNNVKIPVGNYSFKNKFDGTEISAYLGIRPEHVYFEKINPDCFEINLKSELLEYTGHEQIVTFDYFGQQVLGKFASTFDIEINKDLKLNIDTSQISLFDKDTQKRI